MTDLRLRIALPAIALVAAIAIPAAAEAATCYRLPFGNPNLSDGFGSTKGGRSNPHRGVDFPQPAGTKIPAIAAGTVALRTKTSCLGNVVVVKHADGMYSGYAHMQAQSPLAAGTKVAKGTILGRVGTTGTCTSGNHLHLTLGPTQASYTTGKVVDPYKYIKAHQSCAGLAAEDDGAATDEALEVDLAGESAAETTPDATSLETGDEDHDGDVHVDALAEESAASGCSTSTGNGAASGGVVAVVLGALAVALGRRRRARR